MPDTQRLLLNLDIISAINDALKKLDDEGQPLERIHGHFTVEVVKGQFHRVEVASSHLLTEKRQRRTA